MAGINTAFNVGRGRSWGPEARRAPLSPRRTRGPAALPWVYVYLSLFPVIARDSTPQPPPAEGSLLFLRSAIRQIAIDTDDPPFPFFSFLLFLLPPCLFPSPSSALSDRRSPFVPPPALPPFKIFGKSKRQFFHLGSRDNAHSILPRAFFIYLVLFSESPVRHALDRRRLSIAPPITPIGIGACVRAEIFAASQRDDAG